MKRLLLVIVALLGAASVSYGQQREGAWWLTGFVGLNFSRPDPPAVTQLPSGVGNISQATLSDAYGNLRMFGINTHFLFNREFNSMPNASLPDNGAGILILPDPINRYLNHVISCDSFDGRPADLHYTLVDMRLDSGRGDVVPRPPVPGQPWPYDIIERNVIGKLTSAMHTNGQDVWIIYPNAAGDTLRTRRLSAAGLSSPTSYPTTAPVRLATSLPRTTMVNFRYYWITQILRASLDGGRLACPTDSTVELFNFNRATGAISHWLSLPIDGGPRSPRYMLLNAATFSPDGTKLYVSRMPYQGRTYAPLQPALLQFDLTPGTVSGILASRADLLTLPDRHVLRDAQIAMDGRLYFFTDSDTGSALGVVRCPNQAGAACQVQPQHRILIDAGLAPALNQTLFRNAGRLQAQAARPLVCPGDTVRLIAFGAGAETFVWTTATGQPLAGGAQPLVAPSVPTRYRVTGTSACGLTDTASVVVRLSAPLAPFDLGPDVTLPVGQSVTFDAGNPTARHRWSTGDTTQTLVVTQPGTYWVRVFNPGCTASDTVRVERPMGLLDAAQAGAAALVVWPNPATARVSVRAATAGAVWLLDGTGRPVRHARATAGQEVAWELTGLAPGVYVVRAGAAARRLVVAP